MQDNKSRKQALPAHHARRLKILASRLSASTTLPSRSCPIVGHPKHPARPRAYRHRGFALCHLWRVERIRTVQTSRKAAFATAEEFDTGQRFESHGVSGSRRARAPAVPHHGEQQRLGGATLR